MKNKRIVIAGGTGFIGRNLAGYFAAENEVIILSRNIHRSTNNAYEDFNNATEHVEHIRTVQWNGRDLGDWAKEIDGADLVINLAGKSVNCRYNNSNKKEIFDSRLFATKVIGQAINKALTHPGCGSMLHLQPFISMQPTALKMSIPERCITILVCRFASRGSKHFLKQKHPLHAKLLLEQPLL